MQPAPDMKIHELDHINQLIEYTCPACVRETKEKKYMYQY